MQCFQLYLKDSARAWLRSLPRGKIRSLDDLVDTFVKNFSATFKRPVGIEQLRSCKQKSNESMRSYLSRFTKLLNAAAGVSADRAIDAFSEVIRRKRHIEELGRLKPKSMDVLMEIANGWANGEDQILRLDPALATKTTKRTRETRVNDRTAVTIAARSEETTSTMSTR